MPVTGEDALRRASTAVARSVKAGDPDAERAARAQLATESLRRRLVELAAAGVRLDTEQAAELHTLVDRLTGGPVRARF